MGWRCCLFLFFLWGTLWAQVPLHTYSTRHLQLIYYDQAHTYLIPHLARCFENAMHFHRRLFDYSPSEEVTILLQDFHDYGRAGTNTIPWNYINVGIEPYDYVYETSPTNERMNWVFNHELVHVLATDKAAASDRFFRRLFFGKVSPSAENPLSMIYSYLTTPRWYSPRWFHEGIAVFMETWMSGGIGRAQNGYDEMVFRTMVLDSCRFYDIVGLESEGTSIDFQIGVNSYLYGTRFVSYLVHQYGTEKMLRWYNRSAGSKRYFASQFKAVYGLPIDDAWSMWIDWEHQWQRKSLDTLAVCPVTPYRPVIQGSLGSVSRAFYNADTREFYVGMNIPGQIAQIVAVHRDSGKIRKICLMPTPALYYVTSLAYNPSAGLLFYTTHNSSQWRGLECVDVRTGKSRSLLRQARIGDLACNPADGAIWGVRHHNGLSRLVRVPPPYDHYQELKVFKYGRDLYDIDISPDGRWLTGSLVERNGEQKLVRYSVPELMGGSAEAEVLFTFEDNAAQNFIFSQDGNYLYGTSYYSNVSNVFRYDFRQEEMDSMTNTKTGFFRPLPLSPDSLLVFRYTAAGFTPVIIRETPGANAKAIDLLGYKILEEYPEVRSWELQPPNPDLIDLDTLEAAYGRYHGLSKIRMASAYPVLEGYKDYVGVGIRVNLLDPLGGIDALHLTAGYTPAPNIPDDEKAHISLTYQHWNWRFSAAYNRADFYDLFGPTKVSRKGYSLGVRYQGIWIWDKPRILEYGFSVAGYGGLETLPDYQNVSVTYDRMATARAHLKYTYLLRSLGAVEYEQGVTWEAAAHASWVKDRLFPRFYATLDAGFLLPVDHSSLWLRTAAGFSLGDRDEPFANFYFGGFGNNWVDYQEISRYRTLESFPGVEINEIGGSRFGRVLLEWTLPPVRFRRFGTPSLYFRWARLALFTSALMPDLKHASVRETYWNAGTQLDIRLISFALLKSTLSVGFARAFQEGHKPWNEWMVSFKIL
jgi:hypothetical protein